MHRLPQVLSRLEVGFDDPKSVASAGLILPMSLAQQLKVEAQIDAALPAQGLGGKPNAGAKAFRLNQQRGERRDLFGSRALGHVLHRNRPRGAEVNLEIRKSHLISKDLPDPADFVGD